MMSVYGIGIIELIDKYSGIFDEYAAEAKGSMLPDHNPDRETYSILEDAGFLKTMVLYKDGEVAGFAIVVLSVMPHYSEKSCTIESIFVKKEYRAGGSGRHLMDAIEELAAKEDAKIIFLSAPIGGVLEKVAGSFGFKATNTTFSKEV